APSPLWTRCSPSSGRADFATVAGMGLDVELVRIEQAGTSPRRRRTAEVAKALDDGDRFALAVARAQHRRTTPLLDRADIYGTLELSSVEMPQFLDELARLEAATRDAPERAALDAVRRLAEWCRDERGLALLLVGD